MSWQEALVCPGETTTLEALYWGWVSQGSGVGDQRPWDGGGEGLWGGDEAQAWGISVSTEMVEPGTEGGQGVFGGQRRPGVDEQLGKD